jgi:predicted transcriptional regulator
MRFDEILPFLPYVRETGGSKETDCPVCCGQLWIQPLEGDHNEVELKCFGGCSKKKITAELARLMAEENGHEPPIEKERVPEERQAPFATGARKRKVDLYTAADLVAMEFPEPKWAVPGYLCEGLNILAGAQKLGKSWLVLGTAIAVASGGRALGTLQVEPGDVLYLALEDTKRRLKDRLLKLLKGDEAPSRLTITNEWPRLDEGGLGWIRDWLRQKKGARLVIVDTLKKVRPPRGKGGSFYDEDYDVMASLKEVADEFEVCMVAVHHVSKAAHEDVFNSVSGSMGLTGAADATLILERPRGSNAGALHITGRDVEEKAGEDAMSLQFDEACGSWTLQGTVAECGMSDERKQILEVLSLSDVPRSPKEISDMLNKDRTTVRRLLQKMLDQGEVKSAGQGSYIYPREQREQREQGDDETPWWMN